MPNRLVKDRARSSPSLDALSAEAERLFWRLLLAADDYGRFEAEPILLLSACFPRRIERLRSRQVATWYAELCAGPDPVCRTYRVGGRVYGCFRKWDQTARAKTSKYPAPPPDPSGVSTVLAPGESVSDEAQPVPSTCGADAPQMLSTCGADAPVVGVGVGVGVEDGVGGVQGGATLTLAPPPPPAPVAEGGDGDPLRRVTVGPRPRGTATYLPADFALTPDQLAQAVAKGFPEAEVRLHFAAFCAYHRAKGSRWRHWDLAFLGTWLSREVPGRLPRGASPPRPPEGPPIARDAAGTPRTMHPREPQAAATGLPWQARYAEVSPEVWRDMLVRHRQGASVDECDRLARKDLADQAKDHAAVEAIGREGQGVDATAIAQLVASIGRPIRDGPPDGDGR